MKAVEKILKQLEDCLQTNTFKSVETERVELKSLSTGGEWKSFYESVCAFLNTDGGIIIIGIKEHQNKSYTFPGYNENFETNIRDCVNKFTDENGDKLKFDLNDYLPKPEIYDLLNKRVCVVYVDKLPEDEKYVFFKAVARERRLASDEVIKDDKLLSHKEWKEDIKNARELKVVDKAVLEDLDIEGKLNNYLHKLNSQGTIIETLKSDLNSAFSFLNKKSFVINNQPTLLGMLVCGRNIYDFVEGRCQVDCFVDSKLQVAQNKKVLKDNIVPLMESAFRFVINNIQVGVSYEKGGQKLPEYPEQLVREIINNALAHRDYSVNKFVNINIKPNQSIEVRNPGSFRQDQQIVIDADSIKIRRIIPIAKARNPKLADILKVFDKWEGQGFGMASLTNACLDNEINVPYFLFHSENDVSLVVPKGKVYDEESKLWLDGFSGYIYEKLNRRELTDEEKIILIYLYKSEKLNRQEKYTILLTPDNNHFAVISDLEEKGLIFKHQASTRIYPIYLVDRTLSKTDFSQELYDIFSSHYDLLSNDYKEVLNSIYLHNYFSKIKTVTAYSISAYLYFKKNITVTDEKDYQNYKRKVRTIFNRLEEKDFVTNLNKNNRYKPEYLINENFKPPQEILDFGKT
ncbi:MAG TPA: putative DNA binding domain-containing protein [Pyrinomonadaceae bacterium]|nr:putative DNA binding domain-containing protein [Pyrinomonadaceae bacterium]